MKILIISIGYPSKTNPQRLVFLQRLVNKFADNGNECTVIAPVRCLRAEAKCDNKEMQLSETGKTIPTYFPHYLGGWMGKKASVDIIYDFTVKKLISITNKTIQDNHIEFDCVYAHFTGLASICAVDIGKKYGVPIFAAAGESRFVSLEGFNKKETVCALNQMNGIISVSSYNKKILLENGVLDDEHIVVFPNGADGEKFYPQDKYVSRQIMNLPKDAFIIAFVGHFIERKGPLRLQAAAKDIDIKLAFAGSGEQKPEGSNVVFCDVVSPEQMPMFLNAADVFVLPTLNEGCCNAIVEAICCGVPVISSNKSFNYDILDSSCAILVDPNNIREIHDAILKLRNNPDVYQKLQDGVRKRSQQLSLDYRAEAILSWMKKMCDTTKQKKRK